MEKGEYLGECNRTACSNSPATFYNQSTRKYYCPDCATLINRANPESLKIYGSQLCIYGKNKE